METLDWFALDHLRATFLAHDGKHIASAVPLVASPAQEAPESPTP